jgi:toxin secretion/phage lysis holin
VVLLERADVVAKVGFGIVGSVFSYMVGGLGLALTVLLCLMVADYFTGLMVAYVKKDLSSRIGIKGLMKKTYIILLIGAVYLVESSVVHSGGAIGDGITVAYIILEFLSIVENGDKLGVNIGPLRKIIAALKQKENELK